MAGEEDEIQGDAVTSVQLASARRNRARSILYTCTEPVVLFELVLEIARALTKNIQ
jgi:voltage-gated potassium channel Kch